MQTPPPRGRSASPHGPAHYPSRQAVPSPSPRTESAHRQHRWRSPLLEAELALEEQRRRAAVELHNVVIVDRTQFSPNIRNRQALLDFGGQVMGRRVKGPAWSVSPQRREGHHSPNGTAGAVEDPNGTESRRHHHEADNRHSYVEYVTSPPNGHSVGGRSDGRLYDTFDAVLAVGDIKGLDIASRLPNENLVHLREETVNSLMPLCRRQVLFGAKFMNVSLHARLC